MWTPAVELETVRNIHFGTIIPTLKSLLPQAALQPFMRSPNMSTEAEMYSRTYLELLVVSLANNFTGVKDLPMDSILRYVQARFNKATQVLQFINTLRVSASAAFAENLLHCAIHAGSETVVDFLFSEKILGLDVNKNLCSCRGQQSTFIELAAQSGNVTMLKVLLKHGADVNRTCRRGGAGGALLATLFAPLVESEICEANVTTVITILLEAGASVYDDVLDMSLKSLVSYKLKATELLICHSARNCHRQWARRGFFRDAMMVLPSEAAERVASLMFEVGADLSVAAPMPDRGGPYTRSCYIRQERHNPPTVIDAAACTGNLKLVRMFCENGAALTSRTLTYAIRGRNFDLVCYLVRRGACASKDVDHAGFYGLAEDIHEGGLSFIHSLQQDGIIVRMFEKEIHCARLYAASEAGDIGLVKSLLDSTIFDELTPDRPDLPDANDRSGVFGRALVKALVAEKEEVAFTLIDAGADTNIQSEHDPATLEQALNLRNPGLVRALIEAGVDVQHQFRSRYPAKVTYPLGKAVEWGELSVVEDLIFAGADISYAPREMVRGGLSALTLAIGARNLSLTKFLLENGADVNVSLSQGAEQTPLASAVANDDIDMIHLLLAFGSDPSDTTALLRAFEHSRRAFYLLLGQCARYFPHGKRKFGNVVLSKAIRQGDFGSTRSLLDHNADLHSSNQQSYGYGRHYETPLGTAIRAETSSKLKIINLLLDAGANPNMVTTGLDEYSFSGPGRSLRRTALLEAISHGDIAVVRLLLEKGADINFPATRGIKRTPLQQVCDVGDFDLARLLLQSGASVNAPPAFRGGATALQLAAIGGYVGIAELLLDNGADANAPSAKVDGRSAIEGAAEHGRLDMIEFLLHHGAALDPRGLGYNCTAIILARRQGHFAVAKLLESYLNMNQTIEPPTERTVEKQDEHSLDRAIDRPIGGPAERPICAECGTTFKNSSSLTRHTRTQHLVSTADGAPEHQCDFCPKSFKRKDTLHRHLSTHTNTGRVSCSECGTDLSRIDYLNTYHLDANGRCKTAQATKQLPLRTTIQDADEIMDESN